MLAQADEIEADLVGHDALLNNVPKRLCLREKPSVAADRDVAKGINTKLDRIRHPPIKPRRHEEIEEHEEIRKVIQSAP